MGESLQASLKTQLRENLKFYESLISVFKNRKQSIKHFAKRKTVVTHPPNSYHPNRSLTYQQLPVGVGWPMPTPWNQLFIYPIGLVSSQIWNQRAGYCLRHSLLGYFLKTLWFLAQNNKRKKRPLVDMRGQARGCQWLCNRQQWAFWEQPKGHETNASTCSFHFFVIQSVIHAAWKRTDWVPRFGWNTVKPNGERSSQPHHSLFQIPRKPGSFTVLWRSVIIPSVYATIQISVSIFV